MSQPGQKHEIEQEHTTLKTILGFCATAYISPLPVPVHGCSLRRQGRCQEVEEHFYVTASMLHPNLLSLVGRQRCPLVLCYAFPFEFFGGCLQSSCSRA